MALVKNQGRFGGSPKTTAFIAAPTCVVIVLLARAAIGPFLPVIGLEVVNLTVDRIDAQTEAKSICRQTFNGACVDRVNVIETVCCLTSRQGERFITSQAICEKVST